MDTYENYLVSHSDKKNGEDTIDVITFSVFLSNFIKGTIEDRLDLYFEFMHVQDESILIDKIIEVSLYV